MNQFRWYYNATLTILYNYCGYENIIKEDSYSNYSVRDLLRKFSYVEKKVGNLLFQEFIYDENRNEIPVPEWWQGKIHSRLPRGATKKFISGLNSALSNHKAGNTKNFNMKLMRKKDEFFSFEDCSYPSFLNKIKSQYWYTTKSNLRNFFSY
jgi:hypothetical protein